MRYQRQTTFTLAISTACALSAAAHAQDIRISAVAKTEISASATVGRSTDTERRSAAKTLTTGTGLTAFATDIGGTADSSLRTTFAGTRATLTAQGTARGSFFGHASSRSTGTVRYTFRSAHATSGRLRVTISGNATSVMYNTASASATVKVGSTGVDWNARQPTVTRTLPITVDVGGVAVDVAISTSAGSGMSYLTCKANVQLEFVPGPCRATPYGTSCAKLTSTGTADRRLALSAETAIGQGVGVLIIGVRPTRVGLPFRGCWLLVEPLVLGPAFLTDLRGNAVHGLDMPTGCFDIVVQDLVISRDGARVQTTNGVRVEQR